MTSRWFHQVATVLALAAFVAVPAASPVWAAKTKPAAAGKLVQPKENALITPPPTVAGGIDTQAKHALVLEADTGAVLLDKLSDERIPPASMSKVMTAYLVFDYLKQGRAKLEDELPVSEKAWRTQGSKMFVQIGSRVKIDDLLRGMIVQSGNDACIVLAEGLAGSTSAFIDQMNEGAKKIGLKNSHFANVDGLPDPDHYMTARDLATLGMRTIKDFPEYFHYYSEKEFTFNTVAANNREVSINQGNRNPLLYKDLGADGLKTGHTDEAGYSLLGSVLRDKRRVIVVLSGLPSMKARAQESERLVEWAVREFNNYQLFAAGDKVDDAEVFAPGGPITIEEEIGDLPRKCGDMKVTITHDKPVPARRRRTDRQGRRGSTWPGRSAADRRGEYRPHGPGRQCCGDGAASDLGAVCTEHSCAPGGARPSSRSRAGETAIGSSALVRHWAVPVSWHSTRGPGGSGGAEAIHRLLLEGADARWDAIAETCCSAQRREHGAFNHAGTRSGSGSC
jgi:D-alanyl-D-alanine carboxypeptidase (penicillin-binding protein 5/6)